VEAVEGVTEEAGGGLVCSAAGFCGGGGEGVASITGICTHFWHSTSLPVNVTRSPDGNACLQRPQVKQVLW